MSTLDEQYIRARYSMILASIGSPLMPTAMVPGATLNYATEKDFDESDHDEKLILSTLNGHPSESSVPLFESIRGQIRNREIAKLSDEDIRFYFG